MPVASGLCFAGLQLRRVKVFADLCNISEIRGAEIHQIDGGGPLLYSPHMAKKISGAKTPAASAGRADLPVSRGEGEAAQQRRPTTKLKPSALLDTRVVYCGDNLEQLAKLPDACVDLIYIDPPFNSNRNYEVFWGESKEKRAFEDRHENTKAYIDYLRPRCVQLARVLKKTGSFYYHCDWHASHYVKVMLDQIFGENNFQNSLAPTNQTC